MGVRHIVNYRSFRQGDTASGHLKSGAREEVVRILHADFHAQASVIKHLPHFRRDSADGNGERDVGEREAREQADPNAKRTCRKVYQDVLISAQATNHLPKVGIHISPRRNVARFKDDVRGLRSWKPSGPEQVFHLSLGTVRPW